MGDVLLLCVDERPNLIALDALARQVAKMIALVFQIGRTCVGNELEHRVFL